MRYQALSILILLSLVSCNQKNKSTIFLDALNPSGVVGSYIGELPCVDCKRIYTVLQLKSDNSYRLDYTYEGKSEDKFVKEGDWKIDDNNLVLKGVDYQYKINNLGLVQLDLSGKEITGDLADQYLLEKVK